MSDNTKHILALTVGFFIIRLLSFLFIDQPTLQHIIVLVWCGCLIGCFIKKPVWGWNVLILELLIGGTGTLFQFAGLSLRSCLFLIFVILYSIFLIKKRNRIRSYIPPTIICLIPLSFSIIGLYGASRGIMLGHAFSAVVADIIPFAYSLLIIPAWHLYQDNNNKQFLFQLVSAYIIGSFLFSIYTFILFSSGIEVLQTPYYKWFRDVLFGKITDLGNGFWRIVLPEHLLLVPLTMLISSNLIKRTSNRIFISTLLACALLTLVLNFSRAYMLGLAVGFFVLLYHKSWKQWLVESTKAGIIFVGGFILINLAASLGTSYGLDLLGFRVASVVRPHTEESAITRSALLSPIFSLIKSNPLLGNGLGSTFSFYNPITQRNITTGQFDWGYLELWTELGLFGLVIFCLIPLIMIKALILHNHTHPDHYGLDIGLAAGLTGLLIVNITTPVLFHVLGICFLVYTTTKLPNAKSFTFFKKML